MSKKYTRKQIVDKIIKQRKGGKNYKNKRNTTYKKINSVGGADPDNFFKGNTFTIDEFIDKACLTFTADAKGNTSIDSDDYLQEIKEKTTKVSRRMDPAFTKDYERLLKVSEIFDSEEEFFQCVRSFIQMEMFIQDNHDDFLKLHTITLNTIRTIAKKKGVSNANIADNIYGRETVDALTNFFNFIKVLSRKTIIYWINANMTSKTRLSNKVQITNIIRRLKPDYYLYVMFAREEVRTLLSNPFSKKKDPQYKYLISQENRKYIYEIMSEYTKITSPDDMYRVLFDFNTYIQINYGADVDSLNNVLFVLSQYEAAKYSSFTTNKWDIMIDMSSKTLHNYANEIKEVTTSDTDYEIGEVIPRSRYKPTKSLMSLRSLDILQKSFRGEVITRGGFEIFILKGNDTTSEYTNSGNDQEVVCRHQKIDAMHPDVLKVFIPDDSPYKGISRDLKLMSFEDSLLFDKEKRKDNDNIAPIIYKYILYHIASNMKKGETSLVQQQQLGGDKIEDISETSLNPELDKLGEVSQPKDTDPLTFDSVTPETSEKITENQVEQQATIVAKQVSRTEPFIHYEWLHIYARIKESMDNGMSIQDAVSKEDETISKKLEEVYPYQYSDFKDITDNEKRKEELSKQDQDYFDTYGDFFKSYALMHAKSTNPAIVTGKDIFTMANPMRNIMFSSPADFEEEESNGLKSDQINLYNIGSGSPLSGVLYRFVSAYDVEKIDFDEVSNNGNPIYLFVPEVDPKELEKDRFNAPKTISHIVTTTRTNPVEKAGLENISTELKDIPENNDPNPFIHEYTKDNYSDLINIFQEKNFHLFSGFEYNPNMPVFASSYINTIDPTKRDAFFTYKTYEEGHAKHRAFDGISNPTALLSDDPDYNFLYGTRKTNSYEDRITDTQLDEIIKFLDEQTHGLLSSKTMSGYKNVMRENIKLRKTISLLNPEKGYIYTFSISDLIFGESSLSSEQMGIMSKMTVGFFCNFEKINNVYDLENNWVERKNLILWNNPSPAMKQEIMIGAPRMYKGFFKNIWNSLDGKEDPPVAVAVPIGEEGVEPEDKSVSVPLIPVNETGNSQPETASILATQGGEPDPIVSNEDKEETKELSKEETKLGPDAPIPRSISITVTTTIPGHQEFKLEPHVFGINMGKGRRGTNRKTAMLNPQLKLSQKAIDLAGDNIKKQFYDRDLFMTLNNRIASEHMFGLTPIPVDVAINKGIVDHNIDLTVKTLLAPNTIIYLGGEPYVIYNADYDDSSWKIQPKDVVDMKLTMKDVADARVISMQAREGAKELQKLPDTLKRGDNNVEPIPLKQRNPEDIIKEKEEKKKKEDEAVKPTIVNVNGTVVKEEKKDLVDPTPKKLPALPAHEPSTALIKPPKPIVVPIKKELLELPAPPAPKSLPGILSKDIPEKNINFEQPDAISGGVRENMTNFFKYGYTTEYFKPNTKGNFTTKLKNIELINRGLKVPKKNMYLLIDKMNNLVIGKGNNYYKSGIYDNVFRVSTNMSFGDMRGKGLNFSEINYKNYVDNNLQILGIRGDGNCFYNCVSTAFNLENAYLLLRSKDNGNDVKDNIVSFDIIDHNSKSSVVRKNTEFSPMFIRWAVVNYYRDHREKLLAEMLYSSNRVFGYTYTNDWVTANHPKLLQESSLIKDIMIILKDIHNLQVDGSTTSLSIYDTYANQAQQLVQNDKLTEEERHRMAYDIADSLFKQHSYEVKFIHFDRNFPKNIPVDHIFPFSCPVDFVDAEKILMDSSYYAQATDIDIIEEVFKLKVVSIKQEVNTELIGKEGEPQVLKRNIGFRLANDIKNDETPEKTIDYEHVIAVSYENESHYNLIVFNASTTKGEREVKENVKNTKRNNNSSLFQTKKGGKWTRKKRGGAKVSLGNYKKALFPIKRNGITKGFLPDLENKLIELKKSTSITDNNDIKLPRFDEIETSMPFYMYLFMYTSYNQIKERTDDRMFTLFKPFYSEFSVIDTLISDIIVKTSEREEFSNLYNSTFNLEFNDSYLIQNEQVQELSDNDSQGSNESQDMLGGFSRNIPYQPAPITKDVIDILNDDQTNLTFHLNVHLTLRPGIEINKSDIPGLSCESNLQAIKINWAKILGRPYFPTPRNEERFKRDLEKETKSNKK